MLHLLLKLSGLIPPRVLLKFAGLRQNLAKACMRMSFAEYMGLMVLTFLISGVAALSLSLFVLSFSFQIVQALAFSIIVGILAGLASAAACYVYPMFEISSRSRKIDANLPLIANFMSVLASSGMPPERIVRSLANVGDEFSVGEEARRIIADIELLGLDLRVALRNASLRSPSKKFASMLDGVVTTSHMGGDLASYLSDEADKYKKARVQTMKGFLENLATIAEAYISLLIALPLALIVMLSVMSFVGGGAFIGGVDPQVLLTILTFVITPASVGMLLLIVDSVTPPR